MEFQSYYTALNVILDKALQNVILPVFFLGTKMKSPAPIHWELRFHFRSGDEYNQICWLIEAFLEEIDYRIILNCNLLCLRFIYR